jgi:hypothetical protein
MQTNHFLANAYDDDPILWELCKTSASLMLTEKGKTRRSSQDAIEKHRNDTEAEQDRFNNKKKKSSSKSMSGNIINRIRPAVNNNNDTTMMEESRNDVSSSSESRAMINSIIPTTSSPTTPTTQREKVRQRGGGGGGWWRRGVSTSSGDNTRDKSSFAPPSWVTGGKCGIGGRHSSNAVLVSNESSGKVVHTPSTATVTCVAARSKTAAVVVEARDGIEQPQAAVGGIENNDNWSLSESLGKLMNDTRQQKVVYRHFGATNPLQSLKVERTGDMPIPEHDDHVVVKIMVSTTYERLFKA